MIIRGIGQFRTFPGGEIETIMQVQSDSGEMAVVSISHETYDHLFHLSGEVGEVQSGLPEIDQAADALVGLGVRPEDIARFQEATEGTDAEEYFASEADEDNFDQDDEEEDGIGSI